MFASAAAAAGIARGDVSAAPAVTISDCICAAAVVAACALER